MNWKPFNKLKYRMKDNMTILQDVSPKINPLTVCIIAIWIFVGVCLGILGCYLLIN